VPAPEPFAHDAIRLGSMLVTLVEPKPGHEVTYNRWYERDHFYSGCMIGPWTLAGGRFVATRECKDRRAAIVGENEITGDPRRGSYLAIYAVQDGRYKEWVQWAGVQVMWLHENGRMFAEREHVHTQMYKYRWGSFRDDDGVPAELALDRRYPGLVAVYGEATDDDPSGLERWLRDEFLPSKQGGSPIAMTLHSTPRPLQQGPSDVPRSEGSERKFLHLHFLESDPLAVWDERFATITKELEASGLGRVEFASPFLATVFGTDTYTDQLW
jgi:hypothetical protein